MDDILRLAVSLDVLGEQHIEILESIKRSLKFIGLTDYVTLLEDILEGYQVTKSFPPKSVIVEKYPRLADATPYSPDSVEYFLKMMETALRNQVHQQSVIAKAQAGDFDAVRAILDESMQSSMEEVFHVEAGEATKLYDEQKNKAAGVLLGIPEIDAVVNGLHYGSITTIVGGPGCFKTTLSVSAMYYFVYQLGYNCVYMTLEVPRREIIFALISRHSLKLFPSEPLDAEKMKKGMLTPQEEVRMKECEYDLFTTAKGKFFIIDPTDLPDMQHSTIEATLNALDRKYGVDALVVDHMQLLKFYRPPRMEEDQFLNAFVSGIRDMCMRFHQKRGLIAILLSQANRNGINKANRSRGKYDMTSLAEINELERSSYYAFGVWSDDQLKASKEMTVQIIKHRGGSTITDPISVFVDPAHFLVGSQDSFKQVISGDTLNSLLIDDAEGLFA